MAFSSEMIWEVRTNGAATSPGGFVEGAAGVDYSQQDAPQLSFTDLQVKGGVLNRVYSVTHNASLVNMVGNTIYVTADGGSGLFIVQRYQVTAEGNDGNNWLDLDKNCATNNANDGVAALGGAYSGIISDGLVFLQQVVPGNRIYVKNDGTYISTAGMAGSLDALINTPIDLIGYKTSRDEVPVGEDMPLFSLTHEFRLDNYWRVMNIRMTSSFAGPTFRLDTGALIINCRFENTGAGIALSSASGNWNTALYCDVIANSGIAMAGWMFTLGCYIKTVSGTYGLNTRSGGGTVAFCVFDSCPVGINVSVINPINILNNTIYNCTTGINIVDAEAVFILNNIIDSCTTGIAADVARAGRILDYNNYNNNTTDVTNVTKGANATALDPEFVNAGAGDFTIGNSAFADAALSPHFDGLVTSFSEQGAVQLSSIADYPVVGDVRLGTDYDSGVKTGTLDLPSEADVQFGVDYDNAAKTGTFASPALVDVRLSASYGNAGEFIGTLDLPSINDVEDGVIFDGATKEGNFKAPAVTDVEDGVGYGSLGAEFEGNVVLPVVGNVKESVQYGANGTEFTGVFEQSMDVTWTPLELEVTDDEIELELEIN